ncbi:Crp/Fnr family transcriptional regulator [Chryseobacterium fluminis]|uniref:Crp/Fnr family transcriptional regulator n=1 Tax=Chryseobacterium fluminis TaxID=2983606 RepID=UPI0022534B8F|nr:Crp/Fnr family transcriptional regulator [Chryseobacterium sp. MMS21-Ot14]UZT97929.1 Crp/Fnr family transcriptional regulator [Chryseobacterium sp. MMS21-Ot14]
MRKMINDKYLRFHGAVEKTFSKGSYIFSNGNFQNHYYQITDGVVKLFSTGLNTLGMTFQLIRKGEQISLYSMFAEMPLLHDALALTDCRILVMPKECFNKIIEHDKVLMLKIIKHLSTESFSQPLMDSFSITDSPRVKIQQLFHNLKYEKVDQEKFSYEVRLKLKQIADLTNVDIEQIMPCIKSLEEQGLLKIVNDKIYF